MIPDPVRRVRRLALEAAVRAGAVPRVDQLERAGLVSRATSLAVPPPRASAAADGVGSLLVAYCARAGKAVPGRFRSPAHLAAIQAALRHDRRG